MVLNWSKEIKEYIENVLKPQFYSEIRNKIKFLKEPYIQEIILNIPYCNLKCKYCFAKPPLINKEDKKNLEKAISLDLIRKIKLIRKKFKFQKEIRIVSSGIGEALLFQDALISISNIIDKTFTDLKISYLFLTNGTVALKENFINKFKNRDVIIQVSFDLYPKIHDKFRIDAKNNGTSKKVLQFIKEYKKMFTIKINSVFPRGGLSDEEIILFFKFYKQELKDQKININFPIDYQITRKQKKNFVNKNLIESYKKMFTLNEVIFKNKNITFYQHKDNISSSICTTRHIIALIPFDRKIYGCFASTNDEIVQGVFKDEKIYLKPKINKVEDLFKTENPDCKTCPIKEVCAYRSCFLISNEYNWCYLRKIIINSLKYKISKEKGIPPIIYSDKNKTKVLLYSGEKIKFHKLDINTYYKKVFLWTYEKEKTFLSNLPRNRLILILKKDKSKDFQYILR